MKLIYPFLKLKRKWNVFIKKQLRKVGIFPRLIISFMLLLLFTSLFLTFFTFYQYSGRTAADKAFCPNVRNFPQAPG